MVVGNAATPDAPLPANAPSSPPRLAHRKSELEWTSAYHSRDMYPAVVALWGAREKGTFAASFELRLACIDASMAISRPPNHWGSNPAGPDDHLQARLQAKQEIEVRCIRLWGQDMHTLAQPVAGDAFGDRYRQALNVLSRGTDSKGELEVLSEMMAQGMGPTTTALRILRKSNSWRGESWHDRKGEFSAATHLARRLATSSPSPVTADLRDLVFCYRAGSCKDFVSEELAGVPENRRASVETLARDMATALKAGDLKPWMPSR